MKIDVSKLGVFQRNELRRKLCKLAQLRYDSNLAIFTLDTAITVTLLLMCTLRKGIWRKFAVTLSEISKGAGTMNNFYEGLKAIQREIEERELDPNDPQTYDGLKWEEERNIILHTPEQIKERIQLLEFMKFAILDNDVPKVPQEVEELVEKILKLVPVAPERVVSTARKTIQLEYELPDKSYLEVEVGATHIQVLEVPKREYSKALEATIPVEWYTVIPVIVEVFHKKCPLLDVIFNTPCELAFFKVKGKDADLKDFGRLSFKSNGVECQRYFYVKKFDNPQPLLDKYGLTKEEYNEILETLLKEIRQSTTCNICELQM